MNSIEKNKLKEKQTSNVKRINPLIKLLITKTIHLFGKFIFFWKNFKALPKKVRKVLLISLYFNGDILLASPTFSLIKFLYPEAKLDIWIKSRTKQLMEGYENFINKIIIFDEIRTRRYNEDIDSSLVKKITFFNEIKKQKYDLIIDLTGLFWTAFASFYAKAKYTCGFNFQGFGFLYNFESESIYNGHLIDKNLNVLLKNKKFRNKIENLTNINKTTIYFISEENEKYIDTLLKDLQLNPSLNNIVFHTSAGWRAKEWKNEYFLETINLIRDKLNVFLIGGPDDIEKNNYIVRKANHKVFNLTNLLTINQTASLISKADYFVGADSGPLYIAEALNTKTISLFGPTNPLFSAPRNDIHKYLYHRIYCSAGKEEQNCILLAGLNCKTWDCMKLITPSELLNCLNGNDLK